MGIKNLSKFLKTKYPSTIHKINLENLAYKTIAIDTSLYLCKYKVLRGSEWIVSFIDLITCLRELNIHPCFIFDGKAPKEKCLEKDKRKLAREKLENNLAQMELDYSDYINNGVLSENLQKLYKENIKNTRIFGKTKFEPDTLFNIIQSKKNQIINVSKDDIILLKELFDILGINYLEALTEAEKLCAKLCIDNKVDAVLSEDTDLIAYGTPYILSKIDIYNKNVLILDMEILLKTLNFSKEQLLDFCIMCGTDYNNNINKIGNINSYKLITEHKNIDNLADKYDINILKHHTVRNLFTNFDDCIVEDIMYSRKPNFDKLVNFISINDIQYPVDKIKSKLTSKIIF
jgi:5'-3' exonuclease